MDFLTALLYFLGASTLLILGLLAISSSVPIAGFIARSVLSFVCLGICALYGAIASVFLRAFGYGGLGQWTTARAFKWTMRFATGVEFVVQGEEHLKTRPAVFVGNHQTELDVLMLGAIFPPYCSVTAKRQLKYAPILGQFMALSKTVFIDRANSAAARTAFTGASKMMNRERQSVFIFPEGTRSYASSADMLPFKKGAFHLAVQAQVPIVPVVVANYSNVMSAQRRVFRSGRIPVKVLPAVETKGLMPGDVEGLTQRVREMMMDELVKLTEVARGLDVAVSAERAEKLDKENEVKTSGRRKDVKQAM